MNQINQPQKKEKKNPLDIAFQALSVAGDLTDTGVGMAKFIKDKKAKTLTDIIKKEK